MNVFVTAVHLSSASYVYTHRFPPRTHQRCLPTQTQHPNRSSVTQASVNTAKMVCSVWSEVTQVVLVTRGHLT